MAEFKCGILPHLNEKSGFILIWIRHFLVAALAVLMAGIVLTVLVIGVVTVLLQRGPLELPHLRAMVEDRMNAQMDGHVVQVGSVALMSADDGIGNRIMLKDFVVFGPKGNQLVAIPDLRTRFSLLDVINGRMAPTDVAIIGTELSLERDAEGAISLFGAGSDMTSTGENVLELLDSIDQQAGLAGLKALQLENTRVTFRDLVTHHAWRLDNSKLSISREGNTLTGRAVLALGNMDDEGDQATTMILSASYLLGSENASVSFQFADASPTEIADLFQAFDWLRNLDTKLSGSVRADLSGNGTLGNLHGVLEMAEGKLAETPASQPISFDTAKVYFDYDPARDILNLEQVDLKTSSGSVNATGFAQLQRKEDGAVVAMAGQLRLRDIVVQRPDLFDTDVRLKEAALDARLSFNPLKVDVGQLTIFDDESVIKVAGSSVASSEFWTNSYDIDVDRLNVVRLKQLWPKPIVAKTRDWINENLFAGEFVKFSGGFRSDQGEPEYAFNFGFEETNFQFVKTVPNLEMGSGFGYLTHKDLRLDLNEGYVTAPNGMKVDVAGSGLFIPDTVSRPTPGEITLNAKGGLDAALTLLNVEKFRFLDKAGLKPDMGQGVVSVSGWFKLPLSKDAKTNDVEMALTADLLNFESDVLIKGRRLTARKMQAVITDDGIELKGDAELNNVPLNATWKQAFGKGNSTSTVTARVAITDKNLSAFGIVLPQGMLSGSTQAVMDISLPRGSDPKFQMRTDLVGATMRIPALNWSKSAQSKGQFTLSGALGESVKLDELVFNAPGLSAKGNLDLNANNSLQRARFSNVTVGKWLDVEAILIPKGGGATEITIANGTADLRFLGENKAAASGGNGNTTIKVSLDRLRVTNELALTNFNGQMTTKTGLRGTFVGRLNGGTRLDGQLFPQEFGTALELTSADAGGVMSSAGLLHNVRDGSLRVILVPREGKGNYDGTLDVKRVRIKDASAMAALLNGISLVGTLQQLEGEGIHFSTIEGQFKLRDNGVKLEKISAVGPSMGMTLDGWYNTQSKSVDFEGVITPLYAVNGIFERLFGQLVGRRKGEGMFSFTYRMRGPSSKPKVSVNPLSILTPGAFREIFRQKPPEPPSQ